jgi:hypothetical protein
MRRTSILAAFVSIICAVAACATSSPAGDDDTSADDDGQEIDAGAPDATPDAEPCVPAPDGEICNGEDDDCDDATDEGFAGVGEACDVGVGACRGAGTTVCTADGTSTECGAQPLPPGTELCGTTVDEDCDTHVDEGFPDLAAVCSAGTGACLAGGVRVCAADGLSTVCNAVPGTGTPETCNAADDDCDGAIDNGFHVGEGCDGADSDLCIEGVFACNGAGAAACSDNTDSTIDLCDGANNDCDAASADGSEDSRINQSCDGGADTDVCLEGTTSCAGGAIACSDASASTTEACGGNAADEDCDGAVDEGFGRNDNPSCTTGLFNLGTVSGDTGAGASSVTDSYFDEEWDIVRITENDSSVSFPYLSGRIQLYSPPGVDFDLYVYCVSCGGSLIGSATAGGLTGHYDTVDVRNDDDGGATDDFDVIIEVRHYNSDRCAAWQLTVWGDLAAPTQNCDP